MASILFVASAQAEGPHFHEFITARDGQLFEGDQPFRFLSFNIPNLTYAEDDMRFGQVSPFRLPTAYEVNDALATIQQMGGRVARTYVLSIIKTNDASGIPRHLLARDKFNEDAMVVLDQVLESANRHGDVIAGMMTMSMSRVIARQPTSIADAPPTR